MDYMRIIWDSSYASSWEECLAAAKAEQGVNAVDYERGICFFYKCSGYCDKYIRQDESNTDRTLAACLASDEGGKTAIEYKVVQSTVKFGAAGQRCAELGSVLAA